MPWKEPGKGDKDPWSSGDQPPDLDEVFRNFNRKLKNTFGGGGGRSSSASSGSGGMLAILLVAAVFWAAYDSIHIVDEAEQGVVLRFGAYNRVQSPGINFTLPRPFESMITINVQNVRSLEDRGSMLTEDENLVEFIYRVQYQVSSAQNFLFEVRDPETTVIQAAESALREAIGTNRLDAILEGTQREVIRIETQRVLQETLDLYQSGIQVNQFNLEDVNVPVAVREAYSDVIRAREDKERFIEEARIHANSVVPEARGQAARVVQEAEGYRQSTVALAQGEAERFNQLLEEYEKAPKITRKRLYLQTMESVLGRNKKVLIDADQSGNVLYLPLDQIAGEGSAQRSSTMPPLVTTDSTSRNSPPAGSRTSRREGRQ